MEGVSNSEAAARPGAPDAGTSCDSDGLGVPAETLIAQLYEELKALAAARMARERVGHSLTATALVHEVFLRLQKQDRLWSGRKLFFFAAAEAMRRILIDHARKWKPRAETGRGESGPCDGSVALIELDGLTPGDGPGMDSALEAAAVDEHLELLSRLDPEGYAVVKLRYFAGLSAQDTAELLGVERRTVTRRWEGARAWLAERVRRSAGS